MKVLRVRPKHYPEAVSYTHLYPKFIIKKSKDLMIRGSDFYAVWMEEWGLWSTDEQDALQMLSLIHI